MDQFRPDPKLYSKEIFGYTSDDEFSRDKRIQITNEVPTLDAFENLHAVMQNDLWKWFVGSNRIMFDVPFNTGTDGWEMKDPITNQITTFSNAKYVNGMRVKDFGPYPTKLRAVFSTFKEESMWYQTDRSLLVVATSGETYEVKGGTFETLDSSYGVKDVLDPWDNPDDYRVHEVYELPTGIRYEVNGAVLPELDFLLHEGYRYLHSLYPDHPRWADLLTDNEIDDQIVDAGAVVGYVPNVKLFRMITDGLDYGKMEGEDLYRAESYEATKLLIRNLLDDARRKKFFGGKVGYLMFVNDMLFNSKVYNVSRYRPYQELGDDDDPLFPRTFERTWERVPTQAEIDDPDNPVMAGGIVTERDPAKFYSRNTEWFLNIFDPVEGEFQNRPVNWFSRNWDRPFKLLDWRNSSYDYEVPEYISDYATGFTNPYDKYGLWEIKDDSWVNQSQGSTMFSNFYVGQRIDVGGVKASIQRMDEEKRLEVFFSDLGGQWENFEPTLEKRDVVTRLLLSSPIPPSYDDLHVYQPIRDTISKLVADSVLTPTSDLFEVLNQAASKNDVITSTCLIYSNVRRPTLHKFSPVPTRLGAMQVPFYVSVLMYPDTVNAKVRGSAFNPFIEDTPDQVHKKWEMIPGAIISNRPIQNKNDDSFVRVTKVTKGRMILDLFEGEGFFRTEIPSVTAERETAFELLTTNGPVFVFGIPKYDYPSQPDPNGKYYVTSAEVKITSIPLHKDRWMMQRCFSLFLPRVKEKMEKLKELFGTEAPPRSPYDSYLTKMNDLNESFLRYMTLTESFVKDPPTSNRDERVIDHTAAYKDWIKALPTDRKKSVGEKAYEDWKDARDFREPDPLPGKEKEFSRVSKVLIEKSKTYQIQTFEDLAVECSLAENRSYYSNLDPSVLTDDKRGARLRLLAIDGNFDQWRANKWLLLNPIPDRPWEDKPVIVGKDQSFHEGGTKINKVYEITPSPLFSEDLDYSERREIGSGYMAKWNEGWLNTVQICNHGFLINSYLSMDGTNKLVTAVSPEIYRKYSQIENSFTVEFFDLRDDLSDYIVRLPDHDPGLTYITDRWWSDLPSYSMNNVKTIEENVHQIKINLSINTSVNDRLMSALDQFAKESLPTLNPGDKVYPDVFSAPGNLVESIDWDQGTITVTDPLLMSGTFTVKFISRMNSVMDTSEQDNFWKYRYDLQKSNLLDPGDPWDHGFYPSKAWPNNTSGAMIDSPIDSKWFKSELVDRLKNKTSSKFKDGFNSVVRLNYQRTSNKYVLPSLIDDTGELYWEMIPTKVLGYEENQAGTILNEGKLVPVEFHDYLFDNLTRVSRACDSVNVGTNITMQTDNSGRHTPFPGKRWTDDSIHSRFRTLGWTEDTIPYYIEIGTGKLPLFDNDLIFGPPNMNDYSSARSYYEGGVDEREIKKERGEVYAGLGEDGWEGAFYTGDDLYKGVEKDYSEFGIKHVEKPVFESPIGEYELRRFINIDRDPRIFYTLVHSSIIKQEFKDLFRRSEIVMNFERTFDLDVLGDMSVGTFKDVETEIVLVSPDIDVIPVVFDGEYVPSTVLIGAGRYALQWPEPPQFDSTIHYMVVKQNTVISNVLDPQDVTSTKLKSFSFSQMSLIVWEWESRTKGKWVQRDFMFGGIYGSKGHLQMSLSPEFEGQEIEEVDLGTTYMISNLHSGTDYSEKDDVTKYFVDGDPAKGNHIATLKHRLLTKLLGQVGFLQGSSVYVRTFTLEETEKLLVAFYRVAFTGWIPPGCVLTNITPWIDANIVNPDYSTMVPKDWSLLATEEGRRRVVDLTKVYWFISGPVDDSQITVKNGWNSMSNVGLEPGSLYCVMFDFVDDGPHRRPGFRLHRINASSKWSYLLNTDHLPGMDNSEWLTFCRQNGLTLYSGKPWLPIDRKNDIFTTIQLERTKLLSGSFNLKLRIDPDFTSDGWRYSDYIENGPQGAKLISEKIIASESPVFVDDENKILYVYNKFDPEPTSSGPVFDDKYVLKIRENRFFKNALFVIGNYSLDEIEVDGVIKKIPRIHAIDGVSFDVDFLSTIDRLLRFNMIRIRSNYSKLLEANLYSSYVNLEGTLRGIYRGDSDEDWFMMMSFIEARGAERISNRISSGTEFKKIFPIRMIGNRTEIYSDTDIDFSTAKWTGSNDLIGRPLITKFDVRRRITSANSDLTFTYYRNTLLLEGKMNTGNPGRIDFSENERLGDALSHILVGDKVNKIMSIDLSKNSGVDQLVFKSEKFYEKIPDSSSLKETNISTIYNVVKIDFREGYLVGATDTGELLVKQIGSLLALDKEISVAVYKVATGVIRLTGLSYDSRTHSWILTYAGTTPQVKSITLDEEPRLTRIEDIGDNQGFDVNTYQVVQILDVDAKPSTIDTNSYAWVRARDVSFTAVDLQPPGLPRSLLSSSLGTLGNDTVTSRPAAITTAQVGRSGVNLSLYGNTYSEVDLRLRSTGGTKPITVGIAAPPMTDTEAYKFDRTLNEWVKTNSYDLPWGSGSFRLFPILSYWKAESPVRIKTYVVSDDYVRVNNTENSWEEVVDYTPNAPLGSGKISASRPPEPPDIPTIEMVGLEIKDPDEGKLYPPPRVPYGSKNLRISRNHPVFDYIDKVLRNNEDTLKPDNPLYIENNKCYMYTVLEDVFEDCHPFGGWSPKGTDVSNRGLSGADLYLSSIKVMKVGINSYPMKKGSIGKIDFLGKWNGPASWEPPYIWEVAWWCLTNSLAPPKNWTNDYGLRAYIELPPVAPNDEVVYQFGYEGTKVLGKELDPNLVIIPTTPDLFRKKEINPGVDLGTYCLRKNSVTRIPPYNKITIPLEYQNVYVDENRLPCPHRFFTEFLIYSVYYQDYVSNYNSYIASDDFKSYIKILKEQWLYLGEQFSNILVTDVNSIQPARVTKMSSTSIISMTRQYGFYDLERLEKIPTWLKKIPPPDVSNGFEVAAIRVPANKPNLDLAYQIHGSSTFSIIEPVEKKIPVIGTNLVSVSEDELAKNRKDGIYNPYSTTKVSPEPLHPLSDMALAGARHSCHNQKGNVALVIGDQLFFYGLTETIDKLGQIKGVTEKFHWKRASLPHKRHIEFDVLLEMDLKEAIEYVVQIRTQWIRLASALIGPNSLTDKPTQVESDSISILKKVYEWVLNNPVQGYNGSFKNYSDGSPDDINKIGVENRSSVVYESVDQIPTVINMSMPVDITAPGGGTFKVSFIETENGVIPTFGPDVVDHKFISREADKSGYLNKQNFYQYLLYYSTYILGNERFENLIDDGIKKIFMSDQYFCILTSKDDLLTLPLSQTLTREQIENYSNWSVSNISPEYLLSTIDTTNVARKMIVMEGNTHTYGMWPVENTFKGFKINQIECIDNAIVVAGYVQASPIVQQMANEQTTYSVLNRIYPNDSWRTFEIPSKGGGTRFPKYPVIFYSNDGGRSFNRCELPVIEFIPSIKSYNGEYTDPAGSVIQATNQSDLEAFSIHIHGNEVHVWFKNSDSGINRADESNFSTETQEMINYIPLGYTSFEMASRGIAIELLWKENIDRVTKKTYAQTILLKKAGDPKSDIDIIDIIEAKKGSVNPSSSDLYMDEDYYELKLSKTRSITPYEQSVISPIGGMKFILQQPFIFLSNGIQVTKIQDQMIEVTPPDNMMPVWLAEDIRVLVSITPSKPLMDQAKYLEAKDVYLDWTGKFIVPEMVQVEDPVLANRMFSPRECKEVRAPGQMDPPDSPNAPNREVTPKKGIPAISEDEAHLIYEYYDPYIDKNGDQVWDYVPVTNGAGQDIMLVNEEGNYLLERDSWKSNNFVRLFKMITDGIPVTTLVKAPRVRPDFDISVTDTRLSAVLNGIEYLNKNDSIPESIIKKLNKQQWVRYVDVRPEDPKILVESKYISDIMSYMADEIEGDSFFFVWPSSSVSASIPKPIPTTRLGPPNNRDEYAASENPWENFVQIKTSPTTVVEFKDFFKYVERIEELEGPFGSSSNPTIIQERLVPVEIKNSSGKSTFVIFDKSMDVIPIKHDTKIKFSSHVPFIPSSRIQEYIAGQFSFTGDKLQSPNPDFPITGVFIDPKGYGGSMNNDSWDREQPWDIDFEAYEKTLVKNEVGDSVYMIGRDKANLISNYGLDYMDTYDSITIRHEDLVYDDQLVTSWNEGEEYTEGFEYHVYKRPAPKYEIWTPRNVLFFDPGISFNNSGTIQNHGEVISDRSGKYLLTDCISFFKDGFEIDLAELDDTGKPVYKILFLDEEGLEIPEMSIFNDNFERFHKVDNKFVSFNVYVPALEMPADPVDLLKRSPFINDNLTIVLMDKFGQKTEKKFKAMIGLISARMIESRYVTYYQDHLYSKSAVLDMWFDHRTLKKFQRFVTNDQSSVVMKGSSYNPPLTWPDLLSDSTWKFNTGSNSTDNGTPNRFAGHYVSINFNEKPKVSFFNSILDTNSIEFFSNYRTIEKLDLCPERTWIHSGESESDYLDNTHISVWSGETHLHKDGFFIHNGTENVQTETGWSFSIRNMALVAIHGGAVVLSVPLTEMEYRPNILKFKKIVFTRGEGSVLSHPGEEDKRVLVKGLRSFMLVRKAVYQNFKDLLTMKKQTIALNMDPIVERGLTDFNQITEMDPKKRFFSLEKPLPNNSLNDGNRHEVRVKILTTDTQQLPPEFMNHPDHIVEINLVEVDKFGYDRIFFDPEGYPPPPVKLEGRYYHLDHIDMYENENVIFKNMNGFKVYQCDDRGRYVRWILQGGSPVMRVLGNEVGDCRRDVFGSTDRRHNPRRPMFSSSYNWFISQFYVKGQERNPFWQTIEVRDSYDEKLKSWTQKIYTKKWEKAVDKMVEVFVPKDLQYVFIENGITYEFDTGSIKSVISDYIDYESGLIDFILGFPAKTYYDSKYLIRYGLYVKNQFYPGEKNKQVWNSWVKMKFQEEYDFIVNSKENIANPNDKDLAIVPVTEMGLFDRKHRMVAYATFPPVEYRSDSQHISFSLVIRNSMFDVSDLSLSELTTTKEDLN